MDQPTELHPLVMTTRESLKQFGYRDDLLIPNYDFSDISKERGGTRTVALAAFTREPASYKTAWFGVVLTTSQDAEEVQYCRDLGAPLVIALRQDTNSFHLWKMMAHGLPEARGEFPVDTLPEVLRARSIAFPSVSPQLDFYDIGLVPAIEADVHRKLNELLSSVVARSSEIYSETYDREPDSQTYQALFQIIFRFMAAKLLGDRKHEGDWLNPNASTVLQAVDAFYNDSTTPLTLDAAIRNRAWETIRTAIQFQNLSVEALAYVYENTFVDVSTRRAYGTHATPYEVAEYMVHALPIDELPQEERTVFEPFCGAAPFLVAAMGRLRELLPDGMDAKERHGYFKRMLAGMELDSFAREVAFHSLILADYPNSNGWKILGEDVFMSPQLDGNLTRANIVLCNPPYTAFNAQERQNYSPSAANKAVEALIRVLQHPPKMLGFVLPLAYQNGPSYRSVKEQINSLYGNVDVVKLPDNVFQHSSVETVLLLAYGSVQDTPRRREATLSGSSYKDFKHTRTVRWEEPLKRVWEELAGISKLSSAAEVHRGIRYAKGFSNSDPKYVSDTEKDGFVPGLSRTEEDFSPYSFGQVQYLTTEAEVEVGADWAWNLPKVIVSAARRSRGQWVTAAAMDYDELVCTQNFHCIWPKSTDLPLEVLAAIINGPVANAWISQQAGKRHSQVRFYATVPLPALSPTATELVTRYVNRYVRFQGAAEAMNILLKIDAAVLDAYGLSEEAESELLAWFDGARRPGVPGFTGYGPEFEQARAEYRHELAHFQQVERYQDLVDESFAGGLTEQEAQEKERLSRAIDEYNAPFYAGAPQELSHGR